MIPRTDGGFTMRGLRGRFSVRRMMATVVIVTVALGAGRTLSFNRWAHIHRGRAWECGCRRLDTSVLPWPERLAISYHSWLAALCSLCAEVYGQPYESCGDRVPILD